MKAFAHVNRFYPAGTDQYRPSSLGGEGVNFHPPAPALLPPGILVPSPWLLGYLCTFCTLSEKKLGVCMIFYDQNIFSDIAEIVFHPVNLHLVNLSVPPCLASYHASMTARSQWHFWQ